MIHSPRQTPGERIDNLRRLLHYHSLAYYVWMTAEITDAQFDEFAQELVWMQERYPALGTYLPEVFADWDGATGYHLTKYPIPTRGQ